MEPNSGMLTQIRSAKVFSMGTATPLPRDLVFVKSKVKMNAEQLMRKIDSHLKLLVPMGRPNSPHPDNLQGLSSIVRVLEGYENLLSETLDGMPQLKQEVSSLRGFLDLWKQGHCREQRPKPPMQGRLAQLLSRKEYIITVGLEALMGLRDYLNQLLKNLDNLGTC